MLRLALAFVLFLSMCLAFSTQRQVIAAEKELRNASAGAGLPYYQGGYCKTSDERLAFPARTDGEGSLMCFERDDTNANPPLLPMPEVEREKPVGGKVI